MTDAFDPSTVTRLLQAAETPGVLDGPQGQLIDMPLSELAELSPNVRSDNGYPEPEGGWVDPDPPADLMRMKGYIPVVPEYWTHAHGRLAPGRTMLRAPGNVCPRCDGPVPVLGFEGRFPGALSHTDNWTELCSACGQLEGRERMANWGPQRTSSAELGGCLPQQRWEYPPPDGDERGYGKRCSS